MNNPNQTFQLASDLLEFVNQELNRPEEDVMTTSVCHQTRGIIIDMLTAYLLLKGKNISAISDLETLHAMCCQLDAKFSKLDFTSMRCHPIKLQGEKAYCMDIEHVRNCFDIANKVKETVSYYFN
ncbi:MAG: hypothetical protein NTU43_07175 [Bacteroidetes bacterium]|nr:hypothetical protein [Bacteroidota bacterium]